jgi:hypothetical protein
MKTVTKRTDKYIKNKQTNISNFQMTDMKNENIQTTIQNQRKKKQTKKTNRKQKKKNQTTKQIDTETNKLQVQHHPRIFPTLLTKRRAFITKLIKLFANA